MFTDYKQLLEVPGEFQGVDSCAKGAETVGISSIDFICVSLC